MIEYIVNVVIKGVRICDKNEFYCGNRWKYVRLKWKNMVVWLMCVRWSLLYLKW